MRSSFILRVGKRTIDRVDVARNRLHLNQRGMITAFVATVTIALVAVALASFEFGSVINAKRNVTSVSEAAARAGAQPSEDDLRDGGAIDFTGDPAVNARVNDYLANTQLCGAGECTWDTTGTAGNTVRVTITISVPSRVLGLGNYTLTSTGSAQAQRGVSQNEG